uniref:Uncharacterized protein n=1 Tax=Hyaloperonospora arabidopsidis (strain Emoy2) TaxID=559515 RepID=M4BHT2_HYAAE
MLRLPLLRRRSQVLMKLKVGTLNIDMMDDHDAPTFFAKFGLNQFDKHCLHYQLPRFTRMSFKQSLS